MKCKQVKEEFVLVYGEDQDGGQLRVAIQQHVTDCPDCAAQAEHTRRFVTLVREHCRREAPSGLRRRILTILSRRLGR
ncbi:MAG: hypothetical protein MPN21_10355 [Thermoanaerobaculia bacterium]|nr:hypothetical protein [Thermoanaerobaculia bacterium]